MNCMACGKLHRRMPVKIPKAKRLPYISLNGDLAKLRIERKIVPLFVIFETKQKNAKKSPNQKGRGFIVI